MRFRHARVFPALGGALAALAALLAGCGAGAAAGSSAGSAGLTHVSIAVLPIADDAPIYVALRQGLFDTRGLAVTPVLVNSGEQATADLLSGKVQFAFSNYVSTILAVSQGAKLRVVAEADETLPNTNDLMVGRNSPIKSAAQLRGKTIAVNARGNIATMMTDSTLRAYGVPVNSVRYVVVPFPNMAEALVTHTVDAAWMAEPFITLAGEQTGAEELADTASGPMNNFPIAGYATLQSYARANPAVIAGFTAAMADAQALSANRSVVEKALPTYIPGMVPPQVAAVQLDEFPTSLSRARLQRVADNMLSEGLLKQPFNVDDLLGS